MIGCLDGTFRHASERQILAQLIALWQREATC